MSGRKGRLRMSSYGHLGIVGRQPGQCLCLLCRESMMLGEPCAVRPNDLRLLCQFIIRTRNWKKEAGLIRERGNPSSDIEQAVYRVVNAIGPSGIQDMKLTADIAAQILKTVPAE